MKTQNSVTPQIGSEGTTQTRSVKHALQGVALALALVLSLGTAQAQSVAGRIAFGIDAGGNKYYGNYTDNQFAFHGDAFIRWNIFDWLSLHAAYNAGQLKYKTTQASFDYQGIYATPVGTVNHTRVGGWDLMLSYNVFPEQTFVPYFIAGIEALNFEPKNANDVSLRNNANAVYSKNVIGGALGVGFEMYISDKVTFNGKVLLHLPGTDWLDDYSDATNPANNIRQDAFLTMGLGFSYYIFAPPIAAKADDESSRTSNTTNITNVYNTNIIKGDTVYVTGPTDTVYLMRPKVNTIYNFPGTLFIVNTDEFNNNEPGNMRNLYNIKTLVNQCPDLKVEIQGHASDEGTVARNQELSEMRARRIRTWLIGEGVNPDKIAGTVGYGTSDNAVTEPKNASAATLEAARVQNRRIAVKVVQTCK
ncbi:MAG: OmpA family protein [Bacteroidota bacterium]|nr:OmpA family protein [Bacteroidota bacterium]MDP4228867.1 OmpA family protein [Bacteroidota bacterium]MDP4234935.1 OmpA family protein [Bacteroidota bacterium]